jgi:hypothetical protein
MATTARAEPLQNNWPNAMALDQGDEISLRVAAQR